LVEGKCDLVTLVLLFKMTIYTSYQVYVMLLQLCKVLLHDIYKTKGLRNQGQQCYFASYRSSYWTMSREHTSR